MASDRPKGSPSPILSFKFWILLVVALLSSLQFISLLSTQSNLYTVSTIEESLLLSPQDNQTVVNAFRGPGPVQKDDITLVTHASVEKLPRLLAQIQFWAPGPVSAAVYLTRDSEIREFQDFVSHHQQKLCNASFHVLFEEQVSASGEIRFYPYNILRNLAMRQLKSNYFLAVDIDFVTPLECGYEKLSRLVQMDEVKSKLHSSTLLVLPAFEEMRFAVDMPRSKEELLRRVQLEKSMSPFHLQKFPLGHGPTKYSRWYHCNQTFYDIEYGINFEPYVIGFRNGVPQYWPFFRYSANSDKTSWFLEAHYMGFRFAVLCDHYVVHMNHSYVQKDSGNVKESKKQLKIFRNYLIAKYGAPLDEVRWLK